MPAINCEHNCCGHPWLRVLDSYGGRVAPSPGQCSCDCHEARAECTVHGKRLPEGGFERSTASEGSES